MLRIEDIEEFDYRVKQCGLQDRPCDTFQRIIAALKVRRSMIAAWSSRGSRVHDRRRRIAITQVSGVRGADMRGMRVTLFVAVLATIVEISRAESTRQSLQCKNIARDVFINSCKGPRMKRSPQKSDTSNADQIVKATISDAMEENPVGIEIFEPERSYYVQARMPLHQGSYGSYGSYGLMPSRFGGIGHNYQSTNFHQSELITPGLEFMDTQYNGLSGGMYGSSIPMRPKYLIRSVKSDDLLGFNLSPEELEELYDEIGDRMPRNSKNLNKRIFQQIATKCCPNARLCYDNPRIIPCMGY